VKEAALSRKSNFCKHVALQQRKRQCFSQRMLFYEKVSSPIGGEQLCVLYSIDAVKASCFTVSEKPRKYSAGWLSAKIRPVCFTVAAVAANPNVCVPFSNNSAVHNNKFVMLKSLRTTVVLIFNCIAGDIRQHSYWSMVKQLLQTICIIFKLCTRIIVKQ
jgi:hypothetical protein